MNSFLFRPVRGGLDEAMKEKQEFTHTTELVAHVEKRWEDRILHLYGKHHGLDPRIGWDTYLIFALFENVFEDPFPVGYTNAPIEDYYYAQVITFVNKPDG